MTLFVVGSVSGLGVNAFSETVIPAMLCTKPSLETLISGKWCSIGLESP